MDRKRLIRQISQKGIDREGGRLEVTKVLGSGGNGGAFLCRSSDGELVAKVYLPPDSRDLDDQALKRFQAAVSLASKISHPNVIRSRGEGTLRLGAYALPYYLMDRAPETLRARIPQGSELGGFEDRIRVWLRSAFGVACLHSHGVVHRDLKPENILLAPNGQPWVADLGIAHIKPDFVSVSLKTLKAEKLLNRDYYAPEQRFGDARDVDQRVDIYALGCILYELLLGTPPVRHNSPPLASVHAAFEALDPMVNKMTAYEPSDRYSSVEDVMEDLAFVLGRVTASVGGLLPATDTSTVEMEKLVRSSNGARRQLGVEMAVAIGPSALSVLHELTGHGRREVRNSVADALGQLSAPESIPYLVAGLYSGSNKASTFRPSTDTAAEALARYPIGKRTEICAQITRLVRPHQVTTILADVPRSEAFSAATDLFSRGRVLLDWTESEAMFLAQIDEDLAWGAVEEYITRGEGYALQRLIRTLSAERQLQATRQWIDGGIRYHWHYEPLIALLRSVPGDDEEIARLLRSTRQQLMQEPDFREKAAQLRQIASALNRLDER